MGKFILIHYGELGLKKGNRHNFENQLQKNIAEKLNLALKKIILGHKYFLLPLPCRGKGEGEITKALSQVFGIAWFSFAWEVDSNLDLIKKMVKRLTKDLSPRGSFAVRVKRTDKSFPLSSIELEKKLGELIVENGKLKVDLVKPDTTFFVEIGEKKAYLFLKKYAGVGGLPVKSSGKVLALFSGGIDSPVAAWLLAKRGAEVDLLHFSATVPQAVVHTKIGKIHKQLCNYLGPVRLFVIPYVHFQLACSQLSRTLNRYEVLLFRRFMLAASVKVADEFGHHALVLGDNLSQVASQTLMNLVVTDKKQKMPIFRPIIGADKNEIVLIAKRIGTYELSITPYKDCCSLLTKHPITKGKWKILSRAEQEINMESLVDNSLAEMLVL